MLRAAKPGSRCQNDLPPGPSNDPFFKRPRGDALGLKAVLAGSASVVGRVRQVDIANAGAPGSGPGNVSSRLS